MEKDLYQKESVEANENMERLAKENFNRWNEALLSRDAGSVAELYSESNTFLPTVSPEFKKGIEGAESYFEHFLEKNPKGEIVEALVQTIGDSAYLHSGMYNFEVGPDDNRSTVEARFTFLWQKDSDGKWKIAHHHSSVRPKP